MDMLSEEANKQLLTKEWAVKIDTLKATAYLIKFFSSPADYSCVVLVTDTKSVWTEALTSQQFARRWHECNNLERVSSSELTDEEEEWRIHNLDVLTKAHAIGGIADLTFEVAETNFSDMAFVLEGAAFQWRWETCFVGYKVSTEILSKHLILPLISMTHLAFSSAVPISELSDGDMGKAIDKVARTSRRNLDIHVRNTFSKPRVASSVSRMTATFNFAADIPAIKSTAETPDLEPLPPPATAKPIIGENPRTQETPVTKPKVSEPSKPTKQESSPSPPPPPVEAPAAANSDSATEEEYDDEVVPAIKKEKSPLPPSSPPTKVKSPTPPPAKKRVTKAPSSDSDSSVRPVKKTKAPTASSDDSDSDAPKRPAVKRGTRQPIKRGGKKF